MISSELSREWKRCGEYDDALPNNDIRVSKSDQNVAKLEKQIFQLNYRGFWSAGRAALQDMHFWGKKLPFCLQHQKQ